MTKSRQARSARATVGLIGEPEKNGSAVEWFVFSDYDSKRVGKGADALDLATKAVRSLASEGVPAGKSRHDRRIREWMLEIAVESARAQEFRRRLTPKQRAKLDAMFDKIDATFDKIDAVCDRRPRAETKRTP
jgi:hypothetical protein